MLSIILKEATREVHAALEKQLVRQIKAVDSKESYARLLATLYGYYQPVETQINAVLTDNDIPDLARRRKSAWILQDLKELSFSTADLRYCTEIPKANNAASAFGVCYVMEGSTLGGKVISELLLKQTAGILAPALTFFQSYREQTIPMWQAFRQRLDLIPEKDHARAIEAATQTFSKFNHWITTYDVIEL